MSDKECLSFVSGGLFFVLQRFIYWTRNRDDITTGSTGGIQEVPDQFIVLEAGHHIEYFTATRTDVYWSKGS
jgi:hypothetical protein